MSSPKPPQSPDYAPLIAASKAAADQAYALQREQFAWAKDAYAKDREITGKAVDSFLDLMEFSSENARKDRERYETQFQPLEDQLIQDAQTYSTPERKEQEAGRAMAGVSQQFDAARANAERALESYGINPSATRYAALDLGVRVQEAAAKAAAADNARRYVDDTGRALRTQAIDVGRGYPGQSMAGINAATGTGSSAVRDNLATTGSGAATMGTAPQYAAIGGNALSGWGNLLNTDYRSRINAYNAQQQASSGFGSALGLVGGVGLKLLGLEEGGPVPEGASPSRGADADDVPAALTAGEFIVPREAVNWYGEKHFVNLIEKAKKEKAERRGPPPSAIPMISAARTRPTAALPVR